MALVCRTRVCVWEPVDDADDVVGHGMDARKTATMTISWVEDPDGEIQIRSDDPEAERVLRMLLERAGRMAQEHDPIVA